MSKDTSKMYSDFSSEDELAYCGMRERIMEKVKTDVVKALDSVPRLREVADSYVLVSRLFKSYMSTYLEKLDLRSSFYEGFTGHENLTTLVRARDSKVRSLCVYAKVKKNQGEELVFTLNTEKCLLSFHSVWHLMDLLTGIDVDRDRIKYQQISTNVVEYRVELTGTSIATEGSHISWIPWEYKTVWVKEIFEEVN